jgi:hypothetical protein
VKPFRGLEACNLVTASIIKEIMMEWTYAMEEVINAYVIFVRKHDGRSFGRQRSQYEDLGGICCENGVRSVKLLRFSIIVLVT